MPPIGTIVQHYEIGPRLGSGGMGEVYRARDTRLGVRLAGSPDIAQYTLRPAV
jgi:serine/threonine protein kinase